MNVHKDIRALLDKGHAGREADRIVITEFAEQNAKRLHEQVEYAAEQQRLARRTAEAVEHSAKESAAARGDSTKAIMWARVAAFVSLAALVVAAWPSIEPLLR